MLSFLFQYPKQCPKCRAYFPGVWKECKDCKVPLRSAWVGYIMKWFKRIIFLAILGGALFAGTYGLQVGEREQYREAAECVRRGKYEKAAQELSAAVEKNPGYIWLRDMYKAGRKEMRERWGF